VHFDTSKHPRGNTKNKGQFSSKGGGGPDKKRQLATSAQRLRSSVGKMTPQQRERAGSILAARKAKVESTKDDVKITPVSSGRAFANDPDAVKLKIGKQDAGKLGEQIVVSWLKSKGMTDARPMNLDQNNFPIDLIQDHETIEVKTGQASNSKGAQQWRLTIGEPGKAEKEWLAKASPEEKAKWNAEKQRKIHERKKKVLEAVSKIVGTTVKASTMTVILNPDTRTADVFKFEGWHDRISWTSPETQKAYQGTYRYA
jgi:hypothetical protein